MFTPEQKKILQQLGERMLPIEHCGAVINMTRLDFLEEYELDKDAQLHYEKGLSKSALKLMDNLRTQSDKQDWKTTQYLADNVLVMKKTATPTVAKKETSKKKVEEESDDTWLDKLD